MDTLCSRKDIVIRPADKGGAIVILDREAYSQEIMRILSDSDTYSLLSLLMDHMSKFKQALRELVEKGLDMEILNKKDRISSAPSPVVLKRCSVEP